MTLPATVGGFAPLDGIDNMGYGVSIFFLAVGAVLTWAVNLTVQGIELQTIGVILMAVGALGLLFTLLFLSSYTERRRGSVVVEDRDVVA